MKMGSLEQGYKENKETKKFSSVCLGMQTVLNECSIYSHRMQKLTRLTVDKKIYNNIGIYVITGFKFCCQKGVVHTLNYFFNAFCTDQQWCGPHCKFIFATGNSRNKISHQN